MPIRFTIFIVHLDMVFGNAGQTMHEHSCSYHAMLKG